ncbi:MAG: response regulator transcription factor [Armatimonadota bacterium]
MVRVLCVEDDPLVRTYLATRLALERDLEVAAVVGTAPEALAYLAAHPVDVVLLDYVLENSPDGMQLLGAILARRAEQGSRTPRVLFCTGMADLDFERRARAAGADGVLAKNRMADDLTTAVRAVASGACWFSPKGV